MTGSLPRRGAVPSILDTLRNCFGGDASDPAPDTTPSGPMPPEREAPRPPACPDVLTVFIVVYAVGLAFVYVRCSGLVLSFISEARTREGTLALVLVVTSACLLCSMYCLWNRKPWAHMATTVLVAIQLITELPDTIGSGQGSLEHLFFVVLRVAFLAVLWLPPSREFAQWSPPQ